MGWPWAYVVLNGIVHLLKHSTAIKLLQPTGNFTYHQV
jgi:hypothetical protein